MSHFAEIDDDGIVLRAIVAEQDFIDSGLVGDSSNWIQTSYNTHGGVHYGQDGEPDGGTQLRKNYAGTGYTYAIELTQQLMEEEKASENSAVEDKEEAKKVVKAKAK
jgi:hypothetical protein